MPPKTRFRKEEIVDAAFAIAREKGFEEISARNVAKRLGSSVAPIYVNFANIEENDQSSSPKGSYDLQRNSCQAEGIGYIYQYRESEPGIRPGISCTFTGINFKT